MKCQGAESRLHGQAAIEVNVMSLAVRDCLKRRLNPMLAGDMDRKVNKPIGGRLCNPGSWLGNRPTINTTIAPLKNRNYMLKSDF